jgi:hypothetical protein
MKHFKTAFLFIGMAITLLTGIVACSPSKGVYKRADREEPRLPELASFRLDRALSPGGCTIKPGLCIKWYNARKEWPDDFIPPDEMKGKLWVTRISDDASSINCLIEKQKLPRQLYNELVLNRIMTVEEDSYLPRDLVKKAYQNAGIKNVPQEVRIVKGKYPVVVENPPKTQELDNQLKIKITITITVKEGNVTIKIIITIIIDTDP